MVKKLLVPAVLAGTVAFFMFTAFLPTPVFAEGTPTLNVSPFRGPSSFAHWVKDPTVAETGSFAMFVSTDPTGFGGVVFHGVEGLTLSQLNHLGFDIHMISPSFAAGAPRLSVILSNGVVLFPDPFYCTNKLSSNLAYVVFDVAADSTCIVFASVGINGFSWSDIKTGANGASVVCSSGCGSVPISSIFMIQDSPSGTLYLGTMFAGCAFISTPTMNEAPILGSC